MQFLRKIIFYICAAVYVVICPILILYAIGYIYEPGITGGGIVKAGLISLSTAPGGADVYVNDKLYAEKTPTLIRELLPNDYDITLRLPGYDNWQKTVHVKEEKASVFDKVILISSERKQKETSIGNYENLITLSGTDIVLLDGGKGLGSINVYDTSNGKEWPLAEAESPFAKYTPVSFITSENDDSFILHTSSEGEIKYLWIELNENNNTIKDITPFLKKDTSDVKWVQGDDSYIFSIQNGNLTRTDAESGAAYPEYVKGARGYGLFGNEIYVLKSDNVLERMNLNKGGLTVILDDPQVADVVFKNEGKYRIKVLSQDTILFLSSGGALSANKLPYIFADKGVLGVQPDDEKTRVLFWTHAKIGMIDLSTEETENVEFEKGPALTWIYTGGNGIKQVFWVYDDSHMLFVDGKNVLLVSLDPEGDYDVKNILTLKDGSDVLYSEKTGQLYFIPSEGSSLFSTEIVPETSVIQLSREQEEKKKEVDNGI
ncbi:MAG: PEGA domain-containing protein [Candidatus Omnitrophota bacterium]